MLMLPDQFKEARQVNITSLVALSKKETTLEQKNPATAKDQRSQREQTSKYKGQNLGQQNGTVKDIHCH